MEGGAPGGQRLRCRRSSSLADGDEDASGIGQLWWSTESTVGFKIGKFVLLVPYDCAGSMLDLNL